MKKIEEIQIEKLVKQEAPLTGKDLLPYFPPFFSSKEKEDLFQNKPKKEQIESIPLNPNYKNTFKHALTTYHKPLRTKEDLVQRIVQSMPSDEGQLILNYLKYLKDAMKQIRKSNPNKMLIGVVILRKLVSIESEYSMHLNDLTTKIVTMGFIPHLVKILRNKIKCSKKLLRTLQFECTWVLTNIASAANTSKYLIKEGILPCLLLFLKKSTNDEMRGQCIWAVGNICGEDASSRNACVQCGALKVISHNISNLVKLKMSDGTMKNLFWCFSNICRGKPQMKGTNASLAIETLNIALTGEIFSLIKLNTSILVDLLWALSYLSDGHNVRLQEITDVCDLNRITSFLNIRDYPNEVVTPALRTIGNIVTGTDEVAQKVINAKNCLVYLKSLMHHRKPSIAKEAGWTVSNIAAGPNSQIKSLVKYGLLDSAILKCLNENVTLDGRNDFDVRRECLWCIANACTSSNSETALIIAKRGVFKALLQSIQRDGIDISDVATITICIEGISHLLGKINTNTLSRGKEEPLFSIFLLEKGDKQILKTFKNGVFKSDVIGLKGKELMDKVEYLLWEQRMGKSEDSLKKSNKYQNINANVFNNTKIKIVKRGTHDLRDSQNFNVGRKKQMTYSISNQFKVYDEDLLVDDNVESDLNTSKVEVEKIEFGDN